MTTAAAASDARLRGSPRRRYYRGRDLGRMVSIGDLRARTHRLMPRFVLEYLEAGAESEATLQRERTAFADWRFVPRTLVDVSQRSIAVRLLGRDTPMPLAIAPTGLNGLFRRGADLALAQGAARQGVPFIQSTMSNERMEDVARITGLRHWWQLYVFGGDEIWQELLRRADAAGCEALVLTTNTQIFGNREWSRRTRTASSRPTLATIVDAALHPRWLATAMVGGLPHFSNVIDFVPPAQRGFFDSSAWIRGQMWRSLSWDTVSRIRQRWSKPFIVKGLLSTEDMRRARDSGIDGIVLSTHGGRQLDSSVAPLDVLPSARRIVGDSIALYLSGGVRRGTDLIKAIALGADAVLAGRAPLYGLCAGGADGVARALQILADEATDALGLLGASSLAQITAERVVPATAAWTPPFRTASAHATDPGIRDANSTRR